LAFDLRGCTCYCLRIVAGIVLSPSAQNGNGANAVRKPHERSLLMFYHVKELQFNARVSRPDPRFASLLLEQFGGANG
jgi:hypothetical protein